MYIVSGIKRQTGRRDLRVCNDADKLGAWLRAHELLYKDIEVFEVDKKDWRFNWRGRLIVREKEYGWYKDWLPSFICIMRQWLKQRGDI